MGKFTIRSGGQTGVDRAALDTARKFRLPIVGWCPKGGTAEDCPEPPGLLKTYPELRETESADVNVRTERNVRDGDLTLILGEDFHSPGTDVTAAFAKKYGKPLLYLRRDNIAEVARRIRESPYTDINIAGPRESEAPGIYERSKVLISRLLKELL